MAQSANGPKTLFLTAVTDYASAASGSGGNTGLKGDVEGVGTIRQEGDKFYRWVLNSHTANLVAGQPVCYQETNAEAYHEKVILPTSATLNAFAGIAMSAIPASGYGWIQIEGYYASNIVSIGKTSIAAGLQAFPANTVAYLVCGADAQSATVNSVANQRAGWLHLLASIASSSTSAGGTDAGTTAVAGWIHCLLI